MSNSTLCIFSDKSSRGSLFSGHGFESHSGLGFFNIFVRLCHLEASCEQQKLKNLSSVITSRIQKVLLLLSLNVCWGWGHVSLI